VMRMGLQGLGSIASFFVRAIDADPALCLTAVCDLDERKLAAFAEQGLATFTHITSLLDAGDVDAVVVTLPNDLHAQAALAALARGVHVCCEKPLAVTSSEASALEAAAAAGGLTLFTAFHRRYNRNLAALARRMPADRGQIRRIAARYHENILEHVGRESWCLSPRQCGGGCLIDNGPNILDAIRHLVGPLTLRDASLGDVRAGSEFFATLSLANEDGIPIEIALDWALPAGEVKDITVALGNGYVHSMDFLAGFSGFKSSLDHEYRGILTDFQRAVSAGPAAERDTGSEIVRLVEQAYQMARRKEFRIRMSAKNAATARMVKLLFHTVHDRGMRLSPWSSRCISAGEVHELVTTPDRPSAPGEVVNRAGFLGFAEFSTAAVVERGDEVFVGDRHIGTVRGFDECHFPNHYNILIGATRPVTAADIDLRVGDEIKFAEHAG
jgi:predicted dehydrogenase